MVRIDPSEAAYDERARRSEQERSERMLREQESDRMVDMTPAPRSPRTPREQVEAAVMSARVQLDQALAVVRGTAIVDGAAVLRAKIVNAQLTAREAGADEAAEDLSEVLELLTARVRSAEVVVPSSPVAISALVRKRAAVHAVIMRHQEELESGGLGLISEDVLDELIAAAETGI